MMYVLQNQSFDKIDKHKRMRSMISKSKTRREKLHKKVHNTEISHFQWYEDYYNKDRSIFCFVIRNVLGETSR